MIKNSKIRCVDMCIYIDNNIYKPNHNVETIFDYIAHLFYVLAKKKKFFWSEEDYENYSLYSASRMYLRLTSARQFLEDDDPKKLPKIKSVLNYIKKIMYSLKVDYQQEHYDEVYKDSDSPTVPVYNHISDELYSNIAKSNSSFVEVDTINYLSSIPKLIKSILKESPYSNDKKMIHNLYISCLLTFIRSITLSNENKQRLMDRGTQQIKLNTDSIIQNIYYEENLNAPVCWNISDDLKAYVSVLNNRIRSKVSYDIQEILKLNELPEYVIEDILTSSVHELNEDIDD